MLVDRLNRRLWLQGAGGFLLAVPFLPSLLGRRWEREALAAGGGGVKRFVFSHMGHCSFDKLRHPQGALDWQVEGGMRTVALPANLANASATFGATPELAPLRDKITIVQGLVGSVESEVHNASFALSGAGTEVNDTFGQHITIDQVLANSSKLYPTPPPIRAVFASTPATMSVVKNGSAFERPQPDFELPKIFQRLFGGLKTPATSTAPEESTAQTGRDKSILDWVAGDLERLRKSSKTSNDDQQRLATHLELIRDLEKRLAKRATLRCETPAKPDDFSWNADPNAAATDLGDMIVAAFACGVTSLVGCGFYEDLFIYKKSESVDFHEMIHQHRPADLPFVQEAEQYFFGRLGTLAQKLDQLQDPETGASLLDTTLIVHCNEHGIMPVAGQAAHETGDVQVLLLGGGAALKSTGRIYDFKDDARLPLGGKHRPYNEMLLTVMAAAGLGPADWEQDGKAGFGFYNDQQAYKAGFANGDRKSPLPILRA